MRSRGNGISSPFWIRYPHPSPQVCSYTYDVIILFMNTLVIKAIPSNSISRSWQQICLYMEWLFPSNLVNIMRVEIISSTDDLNI